MEMDDPNVYKTICEGKTAGIFQLESPGMTSFMMELQPDKLEDVIAGISLYRPGPMDQIPTYIANKRNPKGKYDHPILEDILDVTYGCMVYQEQVMQIVRTWLDIQWGSRIWFVVPWQRKSMMSWKRKENILLTEHVKEV